MGDIIDFFVRIDSTGKALTSAEKRKAKYYHSPFLREAGHLAARFESYFRAQHILSAAQVARMRHVGLICELMVSLHQGDVINKKAALDSVMKPGAITSAQVKKVRARTALAIVVASLALVPVSGFSLFPKAETPQSHVDTTAPEGSTIAVTDAAARYAEGLLAKRPEVKAIYTSVGHDNPEVYYNVYPRVDSPRAGQLFVVLHEYDQRRTPQMIEALRAELARYPGAELAVREFENGPPIDAPIAIRILGPGVDELGQLAAQVAGVLEKTPGTQYVTNPVRLPSSDLRVGIDREKAGLLGTPTVEIDLTVRLGLAGLTAATLCEESGEEHPVLVGARAPR